MTEKEIIQKIYEVIKLVDCMQYNPSVDFNYLRAKGAYNIIKNQIEHLEAENAELRERMEKAIEVPFVVLDKTTGKEADLREIALLEEWAKSLVYCDMDGFAITQDGALLLLDECGKFEYCPSDRFEIVAEARLEELKEDKRKRIRTMTDEERIERLENKLKEALSRWKAMEKQLSQERLNAENAELLSKFKKVWSIEFKAAEARLKELKEKSND